MGRPPKQLPPPPTSELAPTGPEDEGKKITVVERQALLLTKKYHIITFRGRPMIAMGTDFPHFEPLTMEIFKKIAYPELGGQTRGRMGDLFDFIANTSEDLTENDHLICFGSLNVGDLFDESNTVMPPTVWDMRELTTTTVPPSKTVWRSPYSKILSGSPADMIANPNKRVKPVEFVMSLAGGSADLYDDIMQSLAPLVMEKKPDGAIWWVGDGANGKSTLMDALYRIFPGQLVGLTVKQLTDGRDTPRLNGHLANIVKESSEGRIDDTEVYKSLGTHENFPVHKFHSQETITINGNLHHIFSGNSIPVFNDKGYSARRRTFIIPFNQRFVSDPTFEEKTFTPEMFGRLVMEMCRYAVKLKRNGYRYQFSPVTMAAKKEYDEQSNNAEEYASEIIKAGVVAFDSFLPVRQDYENYCAENGFVPLGVGHMRRAIQNAGFERLSYRDANGRMGKRYKMRGYDEAELVPLSVMRPGLLTHTDFVPEEPEPAPVPEFEESSSETPNPERKVGGIW